MDKIRIKNLRSLQDTGEIELKPLTLLVGKNSSGKSTFLRFFPLMKQTLETRTNEPILWYSSNYVDFGSFNESINFRKKNETIGFEFDFNIPKAYLFFDLMMISMTFRRNIFATQLGDLTDSFHLNIDIECTEKFLKNIFIKFEDHTIELELKNREKITKLKINNTVYDVEPIAMYTRDSSNMLPKVLLKDDEVINHERRTYYSENNYFSDKLFKLLKSLAYGTTSEETIRRLMNRISIGSSEEILNSLKNQETTATKLLSKLKKIEIHDEKFQEIKNYLIGIHLNQIISACNRYLALNFSSIKYIAPIRASAERYYRIQGLSVDEIDPQGTNIPMMIHNMSVKDKHNFNKWTKENFDFEIITSLESGHTSLKLKYGDDLEQINLADTGFGYSQLLPIILVMWQATNINHNFNKLKRNKLSSIHRYLENFDKSIFTIVIEQPELHLHPALQAKLIDTFVQIISKSQEMNINIKIIIETHSETMLNRIGYLIAKKRFDFHKDLVNVVIFNKIDTYESDINITTYSEKGHLLSWPIGFFSPEDF